MAGNSGCMEIDTRTSGAMILRWVGACVCGLLLASQSAALPSSTQLAFSGAEGWAATTPGGRGGQIIRVTTLAASGPGSLREALEASGPRIVVFEVGGVIDLDHGFLVVK